MGEKIILGLIIAFGFVPRAVAQFPVSPNPKTPEIPNPSLPSPVTPLPSPIPIPPPDSSWQLSPASPPPQCLTPAPESDRFFIKTIKVLGSTVLQTEIQQLIKPLENQELTLEDLLCLRSKITELYFNNGYTNSGAFLPNNQNLRDGIVQIQVVEGKLEGIEINGLQRLQPNYVRSRLELAATIPLNRQRLQEALELLQLNPLFTQLDFGQKKLVCVIYTQT